MSDRSSAPKPVALFSGLALRDALSSEILPAFFADTGVPVSCTFEPTSVLLDLIRKGEMPDVLLGVSESIDLLVAEGILMSSSVRKIAKSAIGIAIPLDQAVPTIDSTPAFVEYLLGASSVAYSRSGASGIYFSSLLDRLGIADQVNANATIIAKGFTAQAIVDGKADVAIQQLSELMTVSGVQVVDAFPPELQHLTHFSAGVATRSEVLDTATSLVTFLSTEPSLAAFTRMGLIGN